MEQIEYAFYAVAEGNGGNILPHEVARAALLETLINLGILRFSEGLFFGMHGPRFRIIKR